ncbi:CDP-glucose 4,6-dehydratase [Amylibacter sp.]|nr:CDP-glucose 4,6-dehydratase [Amylibacter sp.]
MNPNFWLNRRVFITGHTGFKGSWLAIWLMRMGAKVQGYSLPPLHEDGIYAKTKLKDLLDGETLADIRDTQILSTVLNSYQPEIIFHLAAQPIVRASYNTPEETFSINVMGLLSLFEATRQYNGARALINVTSDKCYENREWVWPYREDELLGGHDPYSASKACAEILTSSYRRSFFNEANIEIASARAGNVIGGGDKASDRLVPDFCNSLNTGKIFKLRNPSATRPWQHVLEPLNGYITLAEKLATTPTEFAEAWNFGPSSQSVKKVGEIADFMCDYLNAPMWVMAKGAQPHEAQSLALDSSKARNRLGWLSRWDVNTALSQTLDWHQACQKGADMMEFTLSQIASYEDDNR